MNRCNLAWTSSAGISQPARFVDADGLVVTAAHLFAPGRQQVEVLVGKQRLPAELIALDLGHDLALVQLAKQDDGYPFASLADKQPVAGQRIFLLGAPLFRHRVMFPGMVARNDTTYEYVGGHYVEVVHVAASSPQGVSGGPWFDRDGNLVGVQSSMMTLQSAPQGLAFVSPLAAVRDLMKRRRSAASATARVAIEELWEQTPATLAEIPPDVHGVYVRICPQQGPAAKAGLAVGHVALEVDGKPLAYRDDFARQLRRHAPGESLKLRVWTPDAPRDMQITLDRLEWNTSTDKE